MHKGTIGIWMYKNTGGIEPQNMLIKMLSEVGYTVIADFDMRECYCLNNRIMTGDGRDLTDLDILYHMNIDEGNDHQYSILRTFEMAGVKVINPYDAHEAARDKFISNFKLRKAGIRVPPSLLIGSNFSQPFMRNLFLKWKSVLVKPRRNAGGRGIIKFDSCEHFEDFAIATSKFYQEFFLQKFIPFGNRDYRVELIDGKVVGIYSREKKHSFKTNVHCGARFVPCEFNNHVIDIAQKAANVLVMSMTIIDMIQSLDDQKWYILEVNENIGTFVEARAKYSGMVIDKAFSGYDNKKIKMIFNYINLLMADMKLKK